MLRQYLTKEFQKFVRYKTNYTFTTERLAVSDTRFESSLFDINMRT